MEILVYGLMIPSWQTYELIDLTVNMLEKVIEIKIFFAQLTKLYRIPMYVPTLKKYLW